MPRSSSARSGRGHGAVDFEADGCSEPAPPELLLDREQQVVGLVLFQRQVRVACHAEEMGVQDLHALEEHVEMGRDDLLDRHEGVRHPPPRTAAGSAAP